MIDQASQLIQISDGIEVDLTCCTPATSMDDEQAAQYAALFKAISHPARVKMLDIIRSAEAGICVCDVEANFDLSQPTVSHHLKILRDAGLIESEQHGLWVYHRICPETFATAQNFLQQFR